MKSEVYNTDCVEYMKTIPDGYFDLAVADPPYGGGNSQIGGGQDSEKGSTDTRNLRGRFQKYETRHTRGGGWAKKYATIIPKGRIEWDVAPERVFFDELFRVSKNQIIWGGNYFSLPPTRCFLVWRKLTISDVFSMAMAEYAWTSFDGNAKVFEMAPQGKGDRFHPTQKPVELYSWIFRLFANEGMKVFDPMMGSQSSRIAAHFANLDYCGCEIDGDYFRMGNERYDKYCHGCERINEHTIIQQSLF